MTWNGKDVPAELRELPAGRYVVEAMEEEAPALSPEEEAGIEVALESYRQGRVVVTPFPPRHSTAVDIIEHQAVAPLRVSTKTASLVR